MHQLILVNRNNESLKKLKKIEKVHRILNTYKKDNIWNKKNI